MLVVKSTGLVPVMRLDTGAVSGVKPALALKMFKDKAGEAVVIPDGIETEEVDVPGERASVAVVAAVELVPIPDDWETIHHLQQIQLAKKLDPAFVAKDEDEKPTETARRIITAELDRRTAPPATA